MKTKISTFLVFVLFCTLFIGSSAHAATFPITQDFSGSKPSSWELRSAATWNTTVSGDQTLLLTPAINTQSGLGFYNDSFSSGLGIVAQFRYYTGGGTGADGTTFFLVDGDQVDENNIAAGATGGALGYTQSGATPGVPHAYLGIGFDEYGSFIAVNGSGFPTTPDTVVVRGNGNGTSGYGYLAHTNVATLFGQSIDGGWRTARVTITPGSGNAKIRVEMSWDEGVTWQTVINDYIYNVAPPTNLKVGFTGGTGGSNNIHAIGNLEIILPVDLQTQVTVPPAGTYHRGDAFTYTYTVTNASPNDSADTTITNTIPLGELGIDNVAWNLSLSTGGTQSGTSADIGTIHTALSHGAVATVTVTGTVGAKILNTTNLNHTITAVPESGVKDPSPGDAVGNITVTTDAPTAAESALLVITDYAASGGTTTAPTLSDYTTAGITGVTGGILAYLNSLLPGSGATTQGEVQALATLAATPAVTTLDATNLEQTTATLNANFTNAGTQTITAFGFSYGKTTDYELGTVHGPGSNTLGAYELPVTELSCGTLYHFRAYVENAAVTHWNGDDKTFITYPCPVPTTGGVSGGSSVSNQIKNLIEMGNTKRADELKKQFGGQNSTVQETALNTACNLGTVARTLRLGSKGEDVRLLQKYLNCLGFTISTSGPGSVGNETDKFGASTVKVLKALQKSLGLKVDGIFGLKTRVAIEKK